MVRQLSLPARLQGTWWLFPILMVLACTGIGLTLEKFEIVKGFYASPYVMVIAWCALRSGKWGGVLAAALSAVIWNAVFVRPPGLHFPSNEELLAYGSMFGVAWVVGGYRQLPEKAVASRYSGALPFVRRRKRNVDDQDSNNFWDVIATGSWSQDTHVGHEYARIYIERCKGYGRQHWPGSSEI